MKIDRLLGIIIVLLQKEKVTAPYLAEKFEVSRRTINRDIEVICRAGIPVVTLQGSNGGITIARGYKIDKTIFTEAELRAVSEGLLGLDSVAQDKKYQKIIDKFSSYKNGVYETNHVLIDLSSHYKNDLSPKISDIKKAIEASLTVEFIYYSSTGERKIIFDPYLVVFRWSSWYAFGYDQKSKTFRLFKLNRLWSLKTTEQSFEVQKIPSEKLEFDKYFNNEIKAVIIFDESVKYRLIDEYGMNSFAVLPNGKLQFEFLFTNEEYLLEWVLSFGEKAELIEPKKLRIEIINQFNKSLGQYLK